MSTKKGTVIAKSKSSAAGIGNEAVLKATGKSWSEWFALIDAAGGRGMGHKEIVAFVRERHGVGPWWRQMVTVAYEQEHGLREKHQVSSGYQISRSKTIDVPVSALYNAWKDKNRRAAWLADADLAIRKANRNKSLRITWADGRTHLEVNLYPKGKTKSQVVVQHNKLPSAREAERRKAYWAKQLTRLKSRLESVAP
jgi:hypothetical protein